MKIKPLYIYGTVFIAIAVILFILIQQDNTPQVNNAPADIANKEMPKDDIHKGLGGINEQAPSSSNVSEQVKHEMEMLKKDADATPPDTLKMRKYADFIAAAHKQDEAITYYKKILKIDPKRLDILFSISYVYYLKHDYDSAEKYVNQILSRDKKNAQALYNLGAIAATKGNKQKAKDIWTKLIKDNPNNQVAKLAQSSLQQL